ncbi:hypothetical protein Leryth_026571 [Lithospermum erythrorhizon]|nr:hypothetical protein Leryth_026571 [Lithospermum erythrorhizon]
MTSPETTTPPPSPPSNYPSPPPNPTIPNSQQTIPIIELKGIASTLSAFQRSFNNLQYHLNNLKYAVDHLIANKPLKNTNIANNPPKVSQVANKPSKTSKIETLSSSEPNSGEKSIAHVDNCGVSAVISDGVGKNLVGEVKTTDADFLDQELKTHCESMNFRGLKRLLVMNIGDIDTLRLKVPKALKYASNVAKLVLECSGRFYLQGSKAYVKGSPMVTGREASVFILECFLLMEGGGNGSGIDADVKEEADRAAMLWRKRMVTEGGIMNACEIDGRGLLLLMGCYGVPRTFKNNDFVDLLRCSNIREMAGTLRRSNALMEKVPEIIEGMIKNNQEVDAIDVACTFGLEERFDVQTILSSLLQKFKEPQKKASPAAVNEANRKQLAVLKSLPKCLDAHKIDSTKITSELQVEEMISTLEKDISEYTKKMGVEKKQKRRAEEVEAGRRSKLQERKWPRYTGQGLQHQQIGHNSQRNLVDTGIGGLINAYPTSQSMMHAQVAGTGYAAAGAYRGMAVDPSGHVINHGVQTYGYYADPTVTERAVTHSYAAQPSSSLSSLYRPPSSSYEGYVMPPGVSSIPPPNYQSADTVVENDYHPPVVSSNHTSYLY